MEIETYTLIVTESKIEECWVIVIDYEIEAYYQMVIKGSIETLHIDNNSIWNWSSAKDSNKKVDWNEENNK